MLTLAVREFSEAAGWSPGFVAGSKLFQEPVVDGTGWAGGRRTPPLDALRGGRRRQQPSNGDLKRFRPRRMVLPASDPAAVIADLRPTDVEAAGVTVLASQIEFDSAVAIRASEVSGSVAHGVSSSRPFGACASTAGDK